MFEVMHFEKTYRGWQIFLFSAMGGSQIRTECIDPGGRRIVNTIVVFRSPEEALSYIQRYIDRQLRAS